MLPALSSHHAAIPSQQPVSLRKFSLTAVSQTYILQASRCYVAPAAQARSSSAAGPVQQPGDLQSIQRKGDIKLQHGRSGPKGPRQRTVPAARLAAAPPPPGSSQIQAAISRGDLEGALNCLRQTAAAAGGPIQLLGREEHRQLLAACYAAGKPRLALEYVQLLPATDKVWTQLATEASRRGDLQALTDIMTARAQAGLRPTSYSYSALIAGQGNAHRLAAALQSFREAWEAPGCACVEVANAALGACAKAGDWQAAQQVLARMREEGVEPDIITHNTLIKTAGTAGLLPEVQRVFEEMLDSGLRPTPVTYNVLFSSAGRAGCQDAAWLFEVYDDMQASHGVQPNDLILSALFAALSRAPCTPEQLERVFGELAAQRMRDATHNVYTSLLTLVTRQGAPDRAVDVWNAAQQDGVRNSPHLYSALFSACSAGSSPALTDVAAQAQAELQQWWQRGAGARQQRQARGRAKAEERDALFAYNSLLHYLGSRGQQPLKQALALYRRMQASGPTPDAVTYNTLLAACALVPDVRAAAQVFSDMVDAGVDPTERTFGALLDCYAKARDLESAIRVFRSLEEMRFQPNVQIYTSLIDACVKQGSKQSVGLAFQLLDQMKAAGLQPTAVTYGAAMAACQRTGDVERALSLYQKACQEGIIPTDELHDTLLTICTRAHRLSEAVDLVKALARQHNTLQEDTLNSLVRALCGSFSGRALRLLSLIETWGMRPSRRTYLRLIAALSRDSNSEAAYRLYRSMRAHGLEADAPSGSALIICLCKAGQLDTAVAVYEDMLAVAWRRELSLKSSASASSGARARMRGALSKRAQVPDGKALAELVQSFAAKGQLRPAYKFYQQLRRNPQGLAGATASHRRAFELLIESYLRQRNVKRALAVFEDWKAGADQYLATRRPVAAAAERSGLSGGRANPDAKKDAGTEKGSPAAASARQDSVDDGSSADSGAAALAAPAPAASGASGASSTARASLRLPRLSYVTLAFLEASCRNEPEHAWRVYDVLAVIRQQRERKVQSELARPRKQSHHVLGSLE